MTSHHGTRRGIAYPEDLKFLSIMFDEACHRHRISKKSAEGEELAHRLMILFGLGVCGKERLRMSLHARAKALSDRLELRHDFGNRQRNASF